MLQFYVKTVLKILELPKSSNKLRLKEPGEGGKLEAKNCFQIQSWTNSSFNLKYDTSRKVQFLFFMDFLPVLKEF